MSHHFAMPVTNHELQLEYQPSQHTHLQVGLEPPLCNAGVDVIPGQRRVQAIVCMGAGAVGGAGTKASSATWGRGGARRWNKGQQHSSRAAMVVDNIWQQPRRPGIKIPKPAEQATHSLAHQPAAAPPCRAAPNRLAPSYPNQACAMQHLTRLVPSPPTQAPSNSPASWPRSTRPLPPPPWPR